MNTYTIMVNQYATAEITVEASNFDEARVCLVLVKHEMEE